MTESGLRLVVRRVIAASPARLFEAWTTPSQLLEWWGPLDIDCTLAEIDLRVGGRYRLGNRNREGDVLYLSGEFLAIDPPTQLVYTWQLESADRPQEQVTVRFEPRDDGTEVVITHELIPDEQTRTTHRHGWLGCLKGLAEQVSGRECSA